MIRSMTGFGRGEAQVGPYRFVAETKSVNHRFLTTKVRLPREFSHHEAILVAKCSEVCNRGHVTVQLEIEADGESAVALPRLNQRIVERLREIARDVSAHDGISGDLPIGVIFSMPGALEWSSGVEDLDEDGFLAGATESLSNALGELVASRTTEGQALERDLRSRVEAIERWSEVLEAEAPGREELERERLRAKVESLVPEGTEIDERIAQEIVLLADKLDITEELTRLGTHCRRFVEELDAAAGPVGRKLTFLLQEMNREANTVGSKANNAAMQQAAIEIKSELEKMREQVENIE